MKRILMIVIGILFAATNYAWAADDYFYVKPSVGYIVTTSIGNKIDVYDSTTDFEDYSGGPGIEGRIAVGANQLEVSYIYQYYTAEKDQKNDQGQHEKGELSFTISTLDVAYYLFDKGIKDGFNIKVGVGKGTTKFEVDKYELDGKNSEDQLEETAVLLEEIHYHFGITYQISEAFEAYGTYMSQSSEGLKGGEFTNTITSISVSAKF